MGLRIIDDCLRRPEDYADCQPEWLTDSVVGLRVAILDGNKPELCPILADALEDAGCDYAELLDHMRRPGQHSPTCWTVYWCDPELSALVPPPPAEPLPDYPPMRRSFGPGFPREVWELFWLPALIAVIAFTGMVLTLALGKR